MSSSTDFHALIYLPEHISFVVLESDKKLAWVLVWRWYQGVVGGLKSEHMIAYSKGCFWAGVGKRTDLPIFNGNTRGSGHFLNRCMYEHSSLSGTSLQPPCGPIIYSFTWTPWFSGHLHYFLARIRLFCNGILELLKTSDFKMVVTWAIPGDYYYRPLFPSR